MSHFVNLNVYSISFWSNSYNLFDIEDEDFMMLFHYLNTIMYFYSHTLNPVTTSLWSIS